MGTAMPTGVDLIGTNLFTANPNSPRNSPSLSTNIDTLIAGLIAAERMLVGPAQFNALDDRYGAIGNDSHDDTTALNNILAAAAGSVLVLPAEYVFKVTGQINVPANTTVIAYGAAIHSTVTGIPIINMASNTRWYGGEVYATGAGAFIDSSYLFFSSGTVGSYNSNIRVVDVYTRDSAAYAYWFEFCKDVWVVNPRVYNCAYAGGMMASCLRAYVSCASIDMNSPVGSGPGNAYGWSFTRSTPPGNDLTTNPRTEKFFFSGEVENVPIWTGVDTHAGINGIIDAVCKNTNFGVAIGASVGADQVTYTYAPHHIQARCVTDSTVTDGTRAAGVSVTGASGGEKAEGIDVKAFIKGHGTQSNNIDGGLLFRDTIGFRGDVVCIECAPHAVILRGENTAFRLDMTVIDTWSISTRAQHVRSNLGNNTGNIDSYVNGHGTKAGVGTTTVAAGSDGAALPQATINVASTAAFPSAGTIYITSTSGIQIITYTGKTGTTFTGCSGGAGTLHTGQLVNSISLNEVGLRIDDVAGTSIGFPASMYNTATTPMDDAGNRSFCQAFAKTMAVFGANVTTQKTVSAAAVDPATTQTLANDLRTALVAYGWVV